jgi:hypothetical protein
MTEETRGEPERDEALSRLLAHWTPPTVDEALDQRVLTSYRREVRAVPFWKRLFVTSIRVPLPVAVAAIVLLLVAMAFALRVGPTREREEPQLAVTGDHTRTARSGDLGFVTRTSLAGFEPVAEMNVTVVEGDLKR